MQKKTLLLMGLTLALAVLLKLNPEIVLSLPNGSILYLLLGRTPLFCSLFEAWKPKEVDTWLEDGDVVVSAGTKCGTNWLLYMSHLIRVKGNTDVFPFVEVMLNTPWITLRHQPGQDWPEIKDRLYNGTINGTMKVRDFWDHPNYPFRVFKSHEEPEDSSDRPEAVLPVRRRRGVKFIASVRSPYDQLRSFYPFLGSISSWVQRMWGDFPHPYENKNQMLADTSDGGILFNIFWVFPKVWFAYRNEPNVLLLRYEQMLRDTTGTIRTMANFMEVNLTEEEIAWIAHLSSFKEMKKIDYKFDYLLWAHRTHPDRKIMGTGKMMRSGKIGEGESFFDESQLLIIKDHIERHFPNDLREWMELL